MAANKPTAVHFSLIFFVMLSVILGVMFYLNFRDLNDNRSRYTEMEAKLSTEQGITRQLNNDIDLLKGIIGYDYEEVGDADTGASTVIGSGVADLNRVDGLADQNYKSAVAKLETDLQNMTADRDKVSQDLAKKIDEYVALKDEHLAERRKFETRADSAETDLQSLITKKEEDIRTKDDAIDKLRTANTELDVQLQDLRSASVKTEKTLRNDITDLTAINNRLREKLNEVTNVSFEHADGKIVWVDNLARMVWINLGSADNMHKRTTFSIYTKSNDGVARDSVDIKGSIEVTRLIDAHTAEARILGDDIYRPISKGDPIYTPLWAPGRRSNFAIVGMIDLDDDGESDREKFHDIVASVGAAIDHEVDDDGKRLHYIRFPDSFEEWEEDGAEIDVHTKWLIIGEIPDIKGTSLQPEKDRIGRILTHRKTMGNEARKQGVRVLSLNDFLSYVGYKPQRRLFIPGLANRPWALKAGAASTGVNENVSNRSSSGQVSGVFNSGRKRLGQKKSSGQASKLFGGGY